MSRAETGIRILKFLDTDATMVPVERGMKKESEFDILTAETIEQLESRQQRESDSRVNHIAGMMAKDWTDLLAIYGSKRRILEAYWGGELLVSLERLIEDTIRTEELIGFKPCV